MSGFFPRGIVPGHGVEDGEQRAHGGVQVDSVTVASYLYNGPGSVVSTTYPEPAVMSNAFASGSPNDYGNLDRFNRVITSAWTADRSTDHDFYHVDVFYDESSNITWTDDTVLTGWDYKYSIDGLNRLTQAERGTSSGGPPPTTLGTLKQVAWVRVCRVWMRLGESHRFEVFKL